MQDRDHPDKMYKMCPNCGIICCRTDIQPDHTCPDPERWVDRCVEEEANKMMVNNPIQFRKEVQKSLIRHTNAINKLTSNGMYFFDYLI